MTITASNHSVPVPSAFDVLHNPALAALAILEAALQVAGIAVAVEHPDLQTIDDPPWPHRPPQASLALAAVMLDNIDVLAALIARYRATLDAEVRCPLPDDPF